jgi:CHASE3 domain sensor protein
MRLRRLGLLGAAVTFARSERGQRMIQQARQKYDTPENRAKVREAVAGARGSNNRRGRT